MNTKNEKCKTCGKLIDIEQPDFEFHQFGECEYAMNTKDKETWEDRFDKEFEQGLKFHKSLAYNEIALEKQLSATIKQFIKTELENMVEDIVGEELLKPDPIINKYSSEFRRGSNSRRKQIKAKAKEYINKINNK